MSFIGKSSIIRQDTTLNQHLSMDEEFYKLSRLQDKMLKRRSLRNINQRHNSFFKAVKDEQILAKQDKFAWLKQTDAHKIDPELLARRYQTSLINGLTQEKARQKLEAKGPNIITQRQKPHWALVFLQQMNDPFSLFLWFLTVLSIIAYGINPSDVSTILLAGILTLTVVSGAIISYKFNKYTDDLMQSFQNLLPQYTTVIRDGQEKIIKSEKIVEGDIVVIKKGDKIPADIRIFESVRMRVNQSTFTGQSLLVKLTPQCTNQYNPKASKNMVFSGYVNAEGQGKGIVLRVGNQTYISLLAEQIINAQPKISLIQGQVGTYVCIITIWALIVGFLVITVGYLNGFAPIIAAEIAIGVTVASAPGVLNLVFIIMLATTVSLLSDHNLLLKNLYIVEALGSTSCLCTDKTGTLTTNVMTVSKLYFNENIFMASKKYSGKKNLYQIGENKENFQCLLKCALLSSTAKFNTVPPQQIIMQINSRKDLNNTQKDAKIQNLTNQLKIKYQNKQYDTIPVSGDQTEIALLKFFQPFKSQRQIRNQYPTVKRKKDGFQFYLPFNQLRKYTAILVQEKTADSIECVYMKGAPEQIWQMCNQVLIKGKLVPKTKEMQSDFLKTYKKLTSQGQRVLGFSKYHRPFDKNHDGQSNYFQKDVFMNFQQTFLGLVSLSEPIKKGTPQTMLRLKVAGIKIIMFTGDHQNTATAVARQCNIIKHKTANEIAFEQNISLEQAMTKSDSVVIHGDDIIKIMSEDEGLQECEQGKRLQRILSMKEVIFARVSPHQKQLIVKTLQKMNHVVCVTGDGVNDSPSVKSADVGLAMGSGHQATREAADIILTDDSLNNLVVGIQQSRRTFDNLKKSICYVMTSQVSEFVPFLILISLRIPIPIFTLLIDAAVDFIPSVSYALEPAEVGIMTRNPRIKGQRLVSWKLLAQCSGWMGISSFLASFACYWIVMNDFGFQITQLWGKSNIPIFLPNTGDSYNPSSSHFGNTRLLGIKTCKQFYSKTEGLDWINANRPWVDLRMALFKCHQDESGVLTFTQNMVFSECKVQQISIYSMRPICYTTQATKYGQTSYMYGNVLNQVFNLFICKTAKDSIFTHPLTNKATFVGLASQYLLSIGLSETYFMIYLISTRDCLWIHYGIPAIPIGILQVVLDEIRKYLIRNLPADNMGNKNNPKQNCRPNWFYRNTLW